MKKKGPRLSVNDHIEIKSEKTIYEENKQSGSNKHSSSNSLKCINPFLKQYLKATNKKLSRKPTLTPDQDSSNNDKTKDKVIEHEEKTFLKLSLSQINATCHTKMGMRNYDNMENQDVFL